MSFDDLRKKIKEDPSMLGQLDDDTKKFFEHIKTVELESLTDDDFKPKVVWFNTDGIPRITMFPWIDEQGGDWVGALPRPVTMLTAVQDDVDRICVISDSIGTTHMTKSDGTPWQHGEMGIALRDPHSPDFPLVHEVLMVTIVFADGRVASMTCPYHRHEDGPVTYEETVGWVMKPEDDEGLGRVPDTLRDALAAPKMATMLAEAFDGLTSGDFGLTKSQANAHALSAVVKVIMQSTRWACMVGAANEEEADVFKHSFNEGPFAENIRAFDQEAIEELVSIEGSWNAT